MVMLGLFIFQLCFAASMVALNGQNGRLSTAMLILNAILVGCLVLFFDFVVGVNVLGVTPYVWGDKDGESRLFTGIVQALRERQATRVADKAFALHEVLRSIGISRAAQFELQQNVSDVYHRLFIDLLHRKTSLINLLIDVGGPETFPDVPSWVPDWRSSHKNDWGQSEFISHHTVIYGAGFPEPQMMISRDKLGLWACRKGTVREPLPGMTMDINLPGSDGGVEDFKRLVIIYVEGRDIFITTEGIYGTGPPGMAAGDEVMWLRGVAVPMILRPVEEEDSEFKVIGPAVVPGFMDLLAFNGAVHGDGWELVYLI
ncbi:hypothetical protein PFICI_02243 [Pestalotiopsis fici W106-1]|uniref:Uncharacterized protein n=1 Tax=Pestalotiopsis fici (strain W106-1 / CGMCC3.15140) TaxID=1229662 RepID=W3XDQ9_PESFW|nr:uncharacterized protein PFICI_02243 [Pestalotiopsis fici W106-1]ETS84218.1 hypothetical protein PFICI_02243 [Pestalotiopsis fici W106-1]